MRANRGSIHRANALVLATVAAAIGEASESERIGSLGSSKTATRNQSNVQGPARILASPFLDHNEGAVVYHGFVNTTNGSLRLSIDLGLQGGDSPITLPATFDSSFSSTDRIMAHGQAALGEVWSLDYDVKLTSSNDVDFDFVDSQGRRRTLVSSGVDLVLSGTSTERLVRFLTFETEAGRQVMANFAIAESPEAAGVLLELVRNGTSISPTGAAAIGDRCYVWSTPSRTTVAFVSSSLFVQIAGFDMESAEQIASGLIRAYNASAYEPLP